MGKLTDYVEFQGIKVYYTNKLDGGGADFGQDYIDFIGGNFPPQKRVFEWCSGPGFIGFSLLAHGLCKTLCLADINPLAIEACSKTVRLNNLESKVTVYLSDNLKNIPPSEKWDLVVGNPPHFKRVCTKKRSPEIIFLDKDWALHREFYKDVGKFLKQNGTLVIQENALRSRVESFREMIESNGLSIVDTPICKLDSRYYYIRALRRQ
ncbi:MAG: methyltransferase [Deltaproteobacteria bacterium]|uniref:Methyltransferase n=1 Tax=Candidatus Desulfacyla euxinica TaxID=2841693 RepID=A0A8J6N3D1_9DELT|nr:methyltransferase [Candidatus Desulfacyla euxinica]MBU0732667.1 methyltransferase [Pseudomonadota bacterium]